MNLVTIYVEKGKEILYPNKKPISIKEYYDASIIALKFTDRIYNNLYYLSKIRDNIDIFEKGQVITTLDLTKIYTVYEGYGYPFSGGLLVLNLEDHYEYDFIAKILESKGYGSEERVRKVLQMGPQRL